MDPIDIINYFYPQDTKLRRVLIRHSEQVRDKALQIAKYNKGLNKEILSNGAMLHDIGIGKCKAKDIYCEGEEPYIRHGILGAEMLRQYGKEHGVEMEPYARICERHTGSGLTTEEIRKSGLPLPEKDFLPETPEEKVICLADKFFSKSGSGSEKRIKKIIFSMQKFGEAPVQRFLRLCEEFHIRRVPVLTINLMELSGLILFDFVLILFTSCLCLTGEAFTKIKLCFLLVFLVRSLYFYFRKHLYAIDVLIYEIIFLLLIFMHLFFH